MNKETFCSFPFDTIFLGADSGVKTCCSAGTDLGNLNKNSIETILHSNTAQSVRDSIINNQWHPQCSQCKKIELMGGRSERSTNVENNYDSYVPIQLDKTYFKLKKLDLRWSNTCNLACNYCYEYFSSQWSNIKGIKINTLQEDNQESLFLYIEKNKDFVTDINLLGGEPFLQKQNSRLITILKDKRYYVLTNLALPLHNNKIANQIIEEPNAEWGVSFETVGSRYDYVRHNASWDQFVKNIEYVKGRKPSLIFNAHPLYCAYSAFNLIEFYDFITANTMFTDVYWCVIQNIDGLNVFTLSKDLRLKAIEEIERCQLKYPDASGIDHLIDIKTRLIESLDNGVDKNSHFVKWTNGIEKQLSNKEFTFEDLWPELSKSL